MRNKAHKVGGRHKPKKIPKKHHKHYWPYIPVLMMVFAIFTLTLFKPIVERSVLAYATEMSVEQLLAATNEQRVKNGSEPLKINLKLNNAAQAKANDMVERNYWAHNTPDGEEPWVFFDDAGYKYYKAGENLAYGFSTSSTTVTGWMNSPSHRDNLLDPDFTEVGFGFTNGSNFNNSGPETVVVAEYGRPQVLAGSNGQAGQDNSNLTPQEVAALPTLDPQEIPDIEGALEKPTPLLLNTESTGLAGAETVAVSRLASISIGNSWILFLAGVASGAAAAILLAKHAYLLHKLLRDAENFVLHHPVLDAVLVSVILISVFLMQTTGYII